jgi:hypothetical protein
VHAAVVDLTLHTLFALRSAGIGVAVGNPLGDDKADSPGVAYQLF